MGDVFLKGEKIDLIVLDENIIKKSNWYKWFNDQEITKNMQKHYFPNTQSMQLEFFNDSIKNSNNKLQCGIYHKKDNILIGTISLSIIDYINRNCEISLIIGEKMYHNIDYFIESHHLMIIHAFDYLNLHKVFGGTSIKEMDTMFCRVLGYTSEGIDREHMYKNGEYKDVYRFSILRKEYIKLKPKILKKFNINKKK
jgi:ribosomal-protein-alanine N-acetyltransferase